MNSNLGQGKASLERIRQAQRDQEAAEARTQAALRAAREAAALAESSRNEAEREEARVIAAKARVAQAVDELRRHEAETESQKACLGTFLTDYCYVSHWESGLC